MKRNIQFVIALAASLAIASYAGAQMMGGSHNHSSQGTADSTSHSGMMGSSMMTQMGNAMNDMSKQCTMMSTEFGTLESHFDSMMQMQDMKALKSEMQKHHDMMKAMHARMGEQQNMCQHMMSMMHSGGMHGSMMNSGTTHGMMMNSDGAESRSGDMDSHGN